MKLPKLFSKGAEAVLQSFNRVVDAINDETQKLLGQVRERIDAQQRLASAEASAALGEPSEVGGARKQLADVNARIDGQSRLLGGLRSRLAGMSAELAERHREIQGDLPQHVDRIKADFAEEWRRGVEAYSQLLGKRQALEARIGRLELAAPVPAAVELPAEIGGPWQTGERLAAALELLAGWGRAANWPALDAMGGRAPSVVFNPDTAYTLVRGYVSGCGCGDLPAGALVIAACLEPGALAHWCYIGYAVPQSTAAWSSQLGAADSAARAIAAEGQRAEAARVEEELRRSYPQRDATPLGFVVTR